MKHGKQLCRMIMIAALIAAIVLVTAACKKKNKPEAADVETESVGAVPEVIENDSGIPDAETEEAAEEE